MSYGEPKKGRRTAAEIAFVNDLLEARVRRFPWSEHPDPATLPPNAHRLDPLTRIDVRVTAALRADAGRCVESADGSSYVQADLAEYRRLASTMWLGMTVDEFANGHATIGDLGTWFTDGFSGLAALVLDAEREAPSPAGVSLGMLALATAEVIARMDDECALLLGVQQGGRDYPAVKRTLQRLRDITSGHATGVAAALVLDQGFNESARIRQAAVKAHHSEQSTRVGYKRRSTDKVRFHAYLDQHYDRESWPHRSRESLILAHLAEAARELFPDRDTEIGTSTLDRWVAEWEASNGIPRTPGPKP